VCGLFMLTAVGCLDPGDQLSPGTWLERSKRDKHLALVRCLSSQESWQVTCQHGAWSLDNVGNCTTTRRQVEGPPQYIFNNNSNYYYYYFLPRNARTAIRSIAIEKKLLSVPLSVRLMYRGYVGLVRN